MYEELIQAHLVSLKTAERKIEQRSTWANITRVDRLERALSTARGKLQTTLNFSAKVN